MVFSICMLMAGIGADSLMLRPTKSSCRLTCDASNKKTTRDPRDVGCKAYHESSKAEASAPSS